jgi:hypothetical protein
MPQIIDKSVQNGSNNSGKSHEQTGSIHVIEIFSNKS